MAGHVLDHFFFSPVRRGRLSKIFWFTFWTGPVLVSFWWFKDLALGVSGPVNDQWGWKWRPSWNVSDESALLSAGVADQTTVRCTIEI